MRPYEGLLVVALEQAVAAPLASCHFAQGGARVIKIERAEGDFARAYDGAVKGTASYFAWANAGKESLVLDIKRPEDAALLERLLSQADFFIQNLAPGATERAGFGSDALRARHPRLITCDISGYGDSPEMAEMKAYDFLVQCESGLVAVNGAPGAPGRIGVSVCDIGAGMNAVIGLQKALIARGITGKGSGVRLSLFDTAADWMTVPLMHAVYGKGAPKPVGLHHPSIAPYGGFRTQDNQMLVISIQNEREWVRLCAEVFGRPDLARDPRFDSAAARVRNRIDTDTMVASYFAEVPRAEMEERLRRAAIAYGALNSVEDLARHPALRRAKVTLEDGQEADLVAPALRHSFDEGAHLGRVPCIGEHSDTIRAEFA